MPLPRTMQAAILTEQRAPLTVAEVGLPETLHFGQVLVRLDYSGICGSQLGEIAGVKGPDAHLPHLLGHEGSGRVLAVGEGVRQVKAGDAVVLHWMKGAGLEGEPARYTWQGRPLNAGWVTTFNECAIVSENRVTAVPASLDPRIAALFGCAVTTGLGTISNNARLRMGESLIVLGAGGVGLNMIQGAALTSAHPIVGVDLFDNRLELARVMGATHVLNGRTAHLAEALRGIVGSAGADVVIDNTGLPEMIQLGYELTKPRGRTVLVGVPAKGHPIAIPSLPLHFGKVLTGSHGGETDPTEDIPRYLRLHEAGQLALAPLLTHTTPLARINEALDGLRSGAIAGRCLVDLRAGARP
ncbi:MAG: zinc-binding dehydrogenase [Acidobacteria bacterium]|nr:zinc-binding dehydrogenase [Acidobacteriota bacterium]